MFSESFTVVYAAILGNADYFPTFLLLALFLFAVVLMGITLRSLVLIRRIVYPMYDAVLKKTEKEASNIAKEARAHAETVRDKAEQDAASVLHAREQQANQLATRYEERLKSLGEQHAKLIDRYSTLADDTYRNFNTSIKKASESGQVAVKQETNRLLADLRDEHTKLRKHFTTQFQERLESELSAVRESVDAYREAQLRMIDQRIVALVERVAALALQKELSVSEHADMVFRSLEEAKKQGVI